MRSDAAKTPRFTAGISILLLFAAGVVNFFDRASLGVAANSIRSELHLSATEIGALLSAFSFAYGIAQLPLAAALRPCNARRSLGFGLLLWSAAQALSGTVRSFGAFLVYRIALGAGESPFYPAGVYLVRQNTTERQRGRATAVLNLASTLGLASAPPLLTLLMLQYGWRGMFVALGVAGAALAIVWFAVQPPMARAVPKEQVFSPAFLKLLHAPSMWGMMLGFGGLNYVNWFFISWLPGYLETDRHLSVRSSGGLAAFPFLAGAVGALLSGVVTDALVSRGKSAVVMYRGCIVTGLLGCGAATASVQGASSAVDAVVLSSTALLCLQFAGTAGWGLVQAMVPRDHVPAASALQNFGSFLMASLAPIVTGRLLDRTHSFRLAFFICGAMALFGSMCYAALTLRPFPADEVLG